MEWQIAYIAKERWRAGVGGLNGDRDGDRGGEEDGVG